MEITSLEQYTMLLGIHAAALTTLHEIQRVSCNNGMLDDDEIELARTIMHEIQRLLTTMDDQCHAVGARFPGGWEGIKSSIINKLHTGSKEI